MVPDVFLFKGLQDPRRGEFKRFGALVLLQLNAKKAIL